MPKHQIAQCVLQKYHTSLLVWCALLTAAVLLAEPPAAQAGCNSGNVPNTALLGSPDCQAAAPGASATAVGTGSTASGPSSNAFGSNSTASGSLSSAYGVDSTARGADSSAYGVSSTASSFNSSAFGNGSTASGVASSA